MAFEIHNALKFDPFWSQINFNWNSR